MSRKNFTIDKSFSNRLKTLIEDCLDITQAALSSKIGISQGYLSMVLKGTRGASAELMAGLYIHYGNYLHWLLTGEGEINRKPEKEGKCEKDDTYIYKEEDSKTAGLISMTREVLNSDTDYSASLAANIRSFHHAITTTKRMNGMESRLATLEQHLRQSEKIRKEDPPIEKEEFTKRRVM